MGSAESEWTVRSRSGQCRDGVSSAESEGALDALKRGAEGDANLMPLILEAVEARCTLGEVSDSLRSVFGLHKEVVVL